MLQVSSVKKAVRFHPPEVLQGLEALELAREHLQVGKARVRNNSNGRWIGPPLTPRGPSDEAPYLPPACLVPPTYPPAPCCCQAASRAAWRRFLADFAAQYLPFRASVQALAALDCLAGLAALASSPGYTRPALLPPGTPPQLHVQAGRHPVLELLLEARGEQFVPNDTHLQVGARRWLVCCSRLAALNGVRAAGRERQRVAPLRPSKHPRAHPSPACCCPCAV